MNLITAERERERESEREPEREHERERESENTDICCVVFLVIRSDFFTWHFVSALMTFKSN